jgi:hypothetical protein
MQCIRRLVFLYESSLIHRKINYCVYFEQCYDVAKFLEFIRKFGLNNYKNAIHKPNFRMNSENFATTQVLLLFFLGKILCFWAYG